MPADRMWDSWGRQWGWRAGATETMAAAKAEPDPHRVRDFKRNDEVIGGERVRERALLAFRSVAKRL